MKQSGLTSDDLADIKQLMEAVISAAIKDQDKKFDQIDKRFEQIDKRFEQIDKRFEQIDTRFEQIDRRFDDLEAGQNEILNAIGGEIASLSTSQENHEIRIIRLEKART